MNVADLMTRDVMFCTIHDSLNSAARIMWDHDCGGVPVVDDEKKLIGLVTDRDICMASYLQGRPLAEIPIRLAMSPKVITCAATDNLAMVHRLMRVYEVHRIPVIDDGDRVAGIVSLSDIVNAARVDRATASKNGSHASEIAATITAICRQRVSAASNGASPSAPDAVLAGAIARAPRAAKPSSRKRKSP
ncbi:MAG: CBS domain-containing protein [Candidatus Binatus sp.]|uniref:CBS domain-containing protein n=1 Tax=Candidatus Binatus sp. TaxID=2811406 RepID=UPI00271C6DDF|nr:CBS domain-containing protein [Candidatus Binatus sp.]MDO8432746.1 CBS domain-containing protein [Candidatus Binatus sp.]